MRRIIGTLLLAATFCLTSVSVFAGVPSGFIDLSLETASKAAKKDGKNIFVYLSQFNCPSCRWIEGHLSINNELGRAYREGFHFVHVLAPQSEKYTPINNAYKLPRFTPYFLFLNGEGREVCRTAGFNNTSIDAILIAKAGMLTYEQAVAKARERNLGEPRDCYSLTK